MAKEYLSASPPYVVVEKGDTLSEIAEKYGSYIAGTGIYGDGGKLETLMKINDIPNADKIVVGQKIKLSGSADSSSNNSNKAIIKLFGLQSDTDRTIYVSWAWDKSNTDHYQVRWYYATGDGIAFHGGDTDIAATFKHATYNAPSNATKVQVYVKPISKTKTVNGKETNYWTAEWSTVKTYNFKDSPPSDVSAPAVKLDGYKLTASLDNLDINADKVQFQIVKNDTKIYKNGLGKINTGSVSYSCTLDADGEYKVRCRGVRSNPTKDVVGDWSEYSEKVSTIPAAGAKITKCKANSKTSVYLEWSSVKTAKTYDIEYAIKKDNFDKTSDTTTVTGIELTCREITGLETGHEYFFRVRSVNDSGHSAWSGIKSTIIGTDPIAPTTWSSTTTAAVGDAVVLYWVHNSADGSREKKAQISIVFEDLLTGAIIDTLVEEKTNLTDEEDEETISAYALDTTPYTEGVKIKWVVCTMGVTEKYGDPSVMRTIDVYAAPTMELSVTDYEGNAIDTVGSLPFYISVLTGPKTQVPIGYHLSIVANDFYSTVDNMGNTKNVNEGEEVYSKYFDISPSLVNDTYYQIVAELSAGNISLENNEKYTAIVTVSMNSGLTKEESIDFTIAWFDIEYQPNAEIIYDNETYTVTLRPYCENLNGEPIGDVLLSVYRREFDGGFTELISDVENGGLTYITDPHPALDYARYRIVAKSSLTGQVSYYDMPGYPIDCHSVIIQWDEEWRSFDAYPDDPSSQLSQPYWAGSMLILPYNIDISTDYSPDVRFIEYIGREHPVDYYGTQVGETATWNVVIEKDDKETIFALRRLAKWMGKVYVREPSGSGYWANVKVSFPQKHLELTIPVTLSVTRVEGGM